MAKFAHQDSVEIVQAHMLSGDNVTVIADWSRSLIVDEIDAVNPESTFPALNVQCRDDVQRASLGDYVIKHEDGTFSVKKPIAFAHDYLAMEK